ncbi:MAG: hypothetical protein K2Q26_10300 [Bdellovibrionales bacterium]|nr:hypothetical protein [Bdellovibrionales bacterium]
MDRPHFKSESPRHDTRLVEILLRLEKLKVFDNFLSENMLQSSLSFAQDPIYRDLVNLQCDGALHLKDTEGQGYLYALEFECSSKAIDRYFQKLGMYYSAGNIDGVIYICANQEIMDLITRVDDEVRRNKDTVVYRGLESTVLENKEKIFLRGTSGEGLGLF